MLAATALWTTGLLLLPGRAAPSTERDAALGRKFAEIETRLGARLGAMILETGTGREWSYRPSERFPLNSTFKAFACAALLARFDAGMESLGRTILVREAELVTYSPVTERRVGTEMRLDDLCHSAMTVSDNTAANMVLDAIGGPPGFTAFMRSIGDGETRLDRWETELNEARPGDPRDTTTPRAAAHSLRKLVLGDILSQLSRRLFESWLAGNEVSGQMLRASLPKGWWIGDRTGAGGYGSRSIVAVIRPPARPTVVAAIYLTNTDASMDERHAAIAELGSTLFDAVGD